MAKIRNQNLLPGVMIAIIAGALLQREWPGWGLAVVLVAIGFYLLAGAKRTLSLMRNFRGIGFKAKLRVVVWFAALLVGVSALMPHGRVYYFLLLVLLAADYLLSVRPPAK